MDPQVLLGGNPSVYHSNTPPPITCILASWLRLGAFISPEPDPLLGWALFRGSAPLMSSQ